MALSFFRNILAAHSLVVYGNDLPDHLSADSLLYVDKIKVIAPRNRHITLQSSINVNLSWPKDWGLDLNSTGREHHPIGHFPHPVTYILPSHNPPITQTIPTVSTTKDLRIVLNTRLHAEVNVVSTANKTRWGTTLSETILRDPSPSFFSPLEQNSYQSHL